MKKVQRKIFLERFPDFVRYNTRKDEYYFPSIFDSHILTLDSKSARGYARLLATEVAKLFRKMHFEKLYFLSDQNIPWLYRIDYGYKYVNQAFDYLKENNVSKTFSGALELDLNQLPEFIKNLYWLVRCNGIITYVYFIDEGSNVLGSICQYGSVHLNILNEKADSDFLLALNKTKFIQLRNDCKDQLSKSSKIPNTHPAG